MNEAMDKALAELGPTVMYFVLGLALFGASVWVMDKVAPFSIRKEIEEDQNTSLGIIIGAVIVGLSIIIASIIRS